MDTGRIVKIVVVVLGFGAAGTIFALTSASDDEKEAPVEKAQMVDLVCVESGEHVQRPFDEIRAYGMRPRGGHARGMRDKPANPVVVYPVGECGSAGAVLARYCDLCDRFFPKLTPDGKPGVCPDCGK